MNCPKCKTLIETFCKEKCSFICINPNGQIVSYEISYKINENTYLLDANYGYGTTVYRVVKIPMFEPPLNENQEQRYDRVCKRITIALFLSMEITRRTGIFDSTPP